MLTYRETWHGFPSSAVSLQTETKVLFHPDYLGTFCRVFGSLKK